MERYARALFERLDVRRDGRRAESRGGDVHHARRQPDRRQFHRRPPHTGLRAELALRRPSASAHSISTTTSTGPPTRRRRSASSTDVALVGDVNGDGISDLVLFRDGTWYASTHQDGVVDMTFGFGAPGDVPLLGDFDGDGTADLIVFRAGTWYVSTQRDGVVDKVYHFGQAGDVPLCRRLQRRRHRRPRALPQRRLVHRHQPRRRCRPDDRFGGVAGEIPVRARLRRRRAHRHRRVPQWPLVHQHDARRRIGGHRRLRRRGRPAARRLLQPREHALREGGQPVQSRVARRPIRTERSTRRGRTPSTATSCASRRAPIRRVSTSAIRATSTAPGKFGKNNIKLVGVSKYTTIVSPPSGDALYLRGASGYVAARSAAVVAGAAGARGLVLAGGINSVLPIVSRAADQCLASRT